MKKITLFICLIFSLSIASQEKFSTYILVRHAETVGEGPERVLNEIGKKRAEDLKNTLQNIFIDQIYSTNLNRTLQTAEPIAKERNLKIETYDPGILGDFASFLKENYNGKTVLISGHSNTTPGLVNQIIGENRYSDLDETEFYHIFIISTFDHKKFSVLQMAYGDKN